MEFWCPLLLASGCRKHTVTWLSHSHYSFTQPAYTLCSFLVTFFFSCYLSVPPCCLTILLLLWRRIPHIFVSASFSPPVSFPYVFLILLVHRSLDPSPYLLSPCSGILIYFTSSVSCLLPSPSHCWGVFFNRETCQVFFILSCWKHNQEVASLTKSAGGSRFALRILLKNKTSFLSSSLLCDIGQNSSISSQV